MQISIEFVSPIYLWIIKKPFVALTMLKQIED